MTSTPADLLALVGIIALGFLVAVAFYESLSERDVVLARAMRVARRLTTRRWVHVLAYAASVLIVIPLLIVVWANLLEVAFFLVGSASAVQDTGLIAAAIVGAARVLAYLRQRTSHELAKAVPLSLAILVITGGTLNLESKARTLAANPGSGTITLEMLLVLVALELGLRLATDGSNAVLSAIRRRRGSASDSGIWATVRAGVRRLAARDAPPGATAAGAGADAREGRTPPGQSSGAPRAN